MPVNTQGGKGAKKKARFVRDKPKKNRPNLNVGDGEGYYAKVNKRLGGKPAQFEVTLSNGLTDIVIARGNMHKKVWINPGMTILVNNDHEVVSIIKDTDKDANLAHEMMCKVGSENTVFSQFFENSSTSSDEENSNENSTQNINIRPVADFSPLNKIMQKKNIKEDVNNDDGNNDNNSKSSECDNVNVNENQKKQINKKYDNFDKEKHKSVDQNVNIDII